MGNAPPTIPLDYAPRQQKLAKLRRYLLILIVVGVAGYSFWHLPPYYKQARVLLEQRQITNFSRPPGTVVLTNDLNERDRFRSDHTYIEVPVRMGPNPWLYPAADPKLDAVLMFSPAEANPVVRALRQGGVDAGQRPLTMFLHSRRAPGGPSRIVYVSGGFYWWVYLSGSYFRKQVVAGWDEYVEMQQKAGRGDRRIGGPLWQVHFSSYVLEPATAHPGSTMRGPVPIMPPLIAGSLNSIPMPVGSHSFLLPSHVIGPDETSTAKYLVTAPVRFFLGQPEPNDESSFTIDYEANGKPGRMRGTLKTDDTIVLEVLSGDVHPTPTPADVFLHDEGGG